MMSNTTDSGDKGLSHCTKQSESSEVQLVYIALNFVYDQGAWKQMLVEYYIV